LVESKKTIEYLYVENEALKVQETQLLKASKSTTVHDSSLDPDEGLSKVMVDLMLAAKVLG
jgi:hypothetical protein